MCSPALALGVASTVFTATGTYTQAKAQRGMAQYNAQIARNNAKVAEWQAQDATRRGEEEAAAVGRQTRLQKGAQRARMAASGLDLNVGTAQELQDQTDFFGKIDQGTARDNAAKEAWSIRQRGANFQSEAAMQSATARSISPGFAATTSLLGGASRVADRWYS